ncbi:hypothetical protein [Pseudarthrobacter sp. S9]|uniref:MmyB family transcriptional regulator n=1 Tax=Pseudarthrobacter sp. S9 TaxID=3418421 RepID=UPI003CFCE887
MLGKRTEVLAWNSAGHRLVGSHLDFDCPDARSRPNMTRMLFLDEPTRGLYSYWRSEAGRHVASPRLLSGRFADDAELAALVGELTLKSPGFAVICFQGDLFDPLPDALLCNTPYVPTEKIETMPPEARVYEPHVTLDGGADGLDVQRRVAAEAANWLAPGGHLLVEASERQAPLTAEIFARNGLTPSILSSEELYATIIIGRDIPDYSPAPQGLLLSRYSMSSKAPAQVLAGTLKRNRPGSRSSRPRRLLPSPATCGWGHD